MPANIDIYLISSVYKRASLGLLALLGVPFWWSVRLIECNSTLKGFDLQRCWQVSVWLRILRLRRFIVTIWKYGATEHTPYSWHKNIGVYSLGSFFSHHYITSTAFCAGQIFDCYQCRWVPVVFMTLYFKHWFQCTYWGWERRI